MLPTLLLLATVLVQTAKPKPNIVLITTDDLGWHNVGWHHMEDDGFRVADTPHMDALLREDGVEMDRHYAHSICSPSRASFHSGRLPAHGTYKQCASFFSPPLFPSPPSQTVLWRLWDVGKWRSLRICSLTSGALSHLYYTTTPYVLFYLTGHALSVAFDLYVLELPGLNPNRFV